jgi:hypothetical protein
MAEERINILAQELHNQDSIKHSIQSTSSCIHYRPAKTVRSNVANVIDQLTISSHHDPADACPKKARKIGHKSQGRRR